MPEITLTINNLETLRTVDPKLMSYNVEMTEVTGGTFWKAYTPRSDRRNRKVSAHCPCERNGKSDAVV